MTGFAIAIEVVGVAGRSPDVVGCGKREVRFRPAFRTFGALAVGQQFGRSCDDDQVRGAERAKRARAQGYLRSRKSCDVSGDELSSCRVAVTCRRERSTVTWHFASLCSSRRSTTCARSSTSAARRAQIRPLLTGSPGPRAIDSSLTPHTRTIVAPPTTPSRPAEHHGVLSSS